MHDVAYLFLFLAADVDGQLDEAEVEAIAEVLRRRLPRWSEEEVSAVVRAAEAARKGAAPRSVREIVVGLRHAPLSDAQRTALLDDLLQVARADGRVLRAEERFVEAVARAWGVALPAEIMGGPVHDLALVFLFMAMGRAEAPTDAAQEAVAEHLAHWQPGLAPETLNMIVRNAVEALRHGDRDRQLGDAVTAIRAALPLAPQRRAVLAAVLEIAGGDGALSADELAFFRRLADALA